MQPKHSLLLELEGDDHPQYYDESRLSQYLTNNPPTPDAHTHLEADVTDLGNYAEVGHTHSYLPLSGGTVTGATTFNQTITAGHDIDLTGTSPEISMKGTGILYIDNESEAAGAEIRLRTWYSTAARNRIRIDNDGYIYFYSRDGSTAAHFDNSGHLVMASGNHLYFTDAAFNLYGNNVIRFSTDATYTRVHDTAGSTKLWINTDSFYVNATNHYFRDTSSNLLFQMAKSGNEYRLYFGNTSDYLFHDTTANDWKFVTNGTTEFNLGTATLYIPNVYTDTPSGSSPNMHVGSDGRIRQGTSAYAAKKNISPVDLSRIPIPRSVMYQMRDPDDGGQWRYGFIADWMAASDPLLGVYRPDGEIQDFDIKATLALFASHITRIEDHLGLEAA